MTSRVGHRRSVWLVTVLLIFSLRVPSIAAAANPAIANPVASEPAKSGLSKPGPAKVANDKLKPSDPYALIFGTVWDPDDHPVYGIKVRIRRASDKKPHWELASDHSGEFAQRVPAGEADYIISADLKGVKTKDGQALHLAQDVRVHVEYDERVDLSLHLTH